MRRRNSKFPKNQIRYKVVDTMKIVVLAGGLSPERNVSLSSGAMVCEALRSKGHRTALVDLFFGM